MTNQLSRLNRDVRSETSAFKRDVSSKRHTSTVTFQPEPSLLSSTHPHPPTVFTTDRATRTTSDSAFTTFLLALRELDTRNQVTPCQMPDVDHLWTSDDAEDREAAAHRCQPCPLRLTACMTYAETGAERHHVWAGIDHTPTSRKGKQQ